MIKFHRLLSFILVFNLINPAWSQTTEVAKKNGTSPNRPTSKAPNSSLDLTDPNLDKAACVDNFGVDFASILPADDQAAIETAKSKITSSNDSQCVAIGSNIGNLTAMFVNQTQTTEDEDENENKPGSMSSGSMGSGSMGSSSMGSGSMGSGSMGSGSMGSTTGGMGKDMGNPGGQNNQQSCQDNPTQCAQTLSQILIALQQNPNCQQGEGLIDGLLGLANQVGASMGGTNGAMVALSANALYAFYTIVKTKTGAKAKADKVLNAKNDFLKHQLEVVLSCSTITAYKNAVCMPVVATTVKDNLNGKKVKDTGHKKPLSNDDFTRVFQCLQRNEKGVDCYQNTKTNENISQTDVNTFDNQVNAQNSSARLAVESGLIKDMVNTSRTFYSSELGQIRTDVSRTEKKNKDYDKVAMKSHVLAGIQSCFYGTPEFFVDNKDPRLPSQSANNADYNEMCGALNACLKKLNMNGERFLTLAMFEDPTGKKTSASLCNGMMNLKNLNLSDMTDKLLAAQFNFGGNCKTVASDASTPKKDGDKAESD